MKVVLSHRDKLLVELEGTDGSFQIFFDHDSAPGCLRVVADLPDDSGRAGEIYCEDFYASQDFEKLYQEATKDKP